MSISVAVAYDDFDPVAPRYRPQRINALCRLTNFSKSEIKLMYQGFKQVNFYDFSIN